MLSINQEEKEYVIKKFPDLHIYRTVKQKTRRHKYYMEERRDAVRCLQEYRLKHN